MTSDNRTLRLNLADKKLLGVCAGIADYLEVRALIVRLVFVFAILIGAIILVPAYFVVYFYLEHQSGGFSGEFRQHPIFRHFKNVDYKKKLCRNEKKSMFLGICAGVADYLETDVTIVRVVTVALLFVAGPIPWIAYFASYYILDVKPIEKYSVSSFGVGETQHREANAESAQSGDIDDIKRAVKKFKKSVKDDFGQHRAEPRISDRTELRYCTRKFKALHLRLIKMEAYITSKRFNLHQEFKNM